MRVPVLLSSFCFVLLTAGCSEAQPDQTTHASGSETANKGGKKESKKGGATQKDNDAAALIPGLRRVGSLKGTVPESSGLCPAPRPGTYYSFGDGGNAPILYQLDAAGQLLGQLELGIANNDWESLTRDDQGTYYVGDCGNNESLRRDLTLYRVRPEQPNQIQPITFHYPDQTAFPPAKKARNFDCEASVWHAGQVYLFTKDQGQQRTSKVYAVPTMPGDYEAKLVAQLPIPGEVTDAALRPDGHRLVLLGRGELFVLDGNSWEEILKATPRVVSLAGAGQTEGCAFKDSDPNTLLISTEQGSLFEYRLP